MKTAEDWAKEEFGFLYIDDVEPQTKTAYGTTGLLNQIRAIQLDALKEATEIVMLYINADFQCAPSLIRDAILTRIRELESSPKKEGR